MMNSHLKRLSILMLWCLALGSSVYAQNPSVVNGVATYTANKNIGRKFSVPNSWDKIVIKENVTITGSFYMPNRNHPIEIAGESRKTSIIQGDGSRPTDDGIKGRSYSAIRCDKSPDLYVHDLKITKPMKFHIHGGFGNVTVERCDIIAGSNTHTTDGIHGGAGKTVVKDCYIDCYDDALYTVECKLVENTTIVHNKNGGPFMTSWGADVPNNHVCVIRNCTVIDNYDQTNYNHGIFSWAQKHDNKEQTIHNKIEGTFTHKVNPGMKASPMYTIGRPNDGGISNAIMKIDGMCLRQNSVDLRLSTNSKVIFTNCDDSGEEPPVEGTISDITDLKVVSNTCNAVALTWSDDAYATSYRVRRKKSGEATFSTLGDVNPGIENYTDNTVSENTTYIYQVRPLKNGTAVAVSNNPEITIASCDNGDTPPTGDCSAWFSNNGIWKGKGRIAISSDGNEHDKDDWAATPFSLALLASKGLQDNLTLYTFSDHVWGSNHDHANAAEQMRISALEGKVQFGFDNTHFIEAVANPNMAYAAMTAEINASSADNPLFIIAAGPMQVVGKALNDAQEAKLKHVTIISHSNWNNRHSDNPSNWENHNGWTYAEIENTFEPKGLNVIQITDQNGGTGYDGMRANASKFDWLKTSSTRNNSLYKNGSWAWLYDRQVAAKKNTEFDPSDAGMIIYLLTGIEKTEPSDAKALMENPVAPCSNNGGTPPTECEGITDVNGVIMFEAENTTSDLDKWILKTDNPGYSGNGHLEFTGNGINGGSADSPLKYTFTVTEGGLYRLFIRARKRLEGAESDKCNDGYVKMEGDFGASPNAGNNHKDDAPEDMLRKNTKFFGGTANGWGWALQLDAGGYDNKRQAVYNFKAGETYTFTLSGRSIRWNVDRIVFRKEGVSNNDAYAVTEETGCSNDGDNGGGTTPDPITDITDLIAHVNSCSEIKLTWGDVAAEEAYRIRRKIEGEATFSTLDDVNANVTTYIDHHVAENTNYIYQVRPLQGGKAVKVSNNPIAEVPACQVSLPKDCAGIEGGTASIDECGICSGGTTGIEASSPQTWYADIDNDGLGDPAVSLEDCIQPIGYVANANDECPIDAANTCHDPKDCNGVINGTASIDDCDVCSGGNTGIAPNSSCIDCAGTINGDAYYDHCNVCVGGSTGLEECVITELPNPENGTMDVHIHPYPFKDWVRLTFNNTVQIETITLQDLQGTQIGFTLQGGGNQWELRNIQGPSGTYVLKVITDQGVVIENILRQ